MRGLIRGLTVFSLNIVAWYYFIMLIMWLANINLDRILSMQPYMLWTTGILLLLSVFTFIHDSDDY